MLQSECRSSFFASTSRSACPPILGLFSIFGRSHPLLSSLSPETTSRDLNAPACDQNLHPSLTMAVLLDPLGFVRPSRPLRIYNERLNVL